MTSSDQGIELVAQEYLGLSINTLRPSQNGHNFADDIFKYIFLNDNV